MNLKIEFVEPKPEPPTIDIVPQVVSPEATKVEERLNQARAELARLKAGK